MLSRVQPAQQGDLSSSGHLHAALRGHPSIDMHEESRTRTRAHRRGVVADHNRVVVTGTGPAQIFARAFVEITGAGRAMPVRVIARATRIADPPVTGTDLPVRHLGTRVGLPTEGGRQVERSSRSTAGALLRRTNTSGTHPHG